MEVITDEIQLLNNIFIINGSTLVVLLLDFSIKWLIKPLCDWMSSMFSESEAK